MDGGDLIKNSMNLKMRDERREIHNHSVLVIHCQNSIFFHFECSKEKESCIFPFVQQWFITFSGKEI